MAIDPVTGGEEAAAGIGNAISSVFNYILSFFKAKNTPEIIANDESKKEQKNIAYLRMLNERAAGGDVSALEELEKQDS